MSAPRVDRHADASEEIRQEYALERFLARRDGRLPRPRRWVAADYWRRRLGRSGSRNPARFEVLESSRVDDTLEDTSTPSPLDVVASHEVSAIVRRAVRTLLSDRHYVVVSRYYFEGVQMQAIGLALGVTETRVCQIHAVALTRLRRSPLLWSAFRCACAR